MTDLPASPHRTPDAASRRALALATAVLTLAAGVVAPGLTHAQSPAAQGQQQAARPIAGLTMDFAGEVEARVRGDLEEATAQVFASNRQWRFIAPAEARARLNPIVRDCFTSECLVQAGITLEARAGLAVEISGEAQIYDWTLRLYDLQTGQELGRQSGSCELCGRSEVARSYARSLQNLLATANVPAAPPATPPAPRAAGSEAQAAGEPAADEQAVQAPAPADGEQRVRVRVSVVPAEASIFFDDALVGQGDVTLPVAVGRHTLRFSAAGYRSLEETLIVNEHSPEQILLRVHLNQTLEAPRPVAESSSGPIDRLGDERKLWGWIATGAGAALIGTGAVLASMHGDPACDGGAFTACPDLYETAGAAVFTSVLGAVVLSGGVGLLTWDLLTGRDAGGDDTLQVGASAGPEHVGVRLFKRF